MSEPKTLPVSNVEIILALLERISRDIHDYVSKPQPQPFNAEAVRSECAKLYAVSEELVAMADAARAKAQADAGANGSAPADQVN
jgi:hypothetical protein